MVFTEVGMTTDVSVEQSRNAFSPIDVTPRGMTTTSAHVGSHATASVVGHVSPAIVSVQTSSAATAVEARRSTAKRTGTKMMMIRDILDQELYRRIGLRLRYLAIKKIQ